MQFLLAYFFLSWLFFTISSTQIDLSSSPIDLFHDDSQLFAAEPQLGEAESLDQSFASDSNLFSDDYQLLSADEPDPDYLLPDIDLNQFAESDPSLLAAGDTACESSDATDPQLFGKIQGRGDTCKAPPRGEAGGLPPQPDDGDQLTDLGFTNFATNRRTMSVFPRNYDICPYEKYSGANIPVCKEPNLADVSQVQGVPWFNLRNVVPLYWDGNIRECLSYGSTTAVLWCCQILKFRMKKPEEIQPLDEHIITFLLGLNTQGFNRLMSLRLNVYDANICYQQS